MTAEILAAAKSGDTATLERLLEKDPAAACAEEDGVSALMWAIYHGQSAAAERLASAKGRLTLYEAAALGDIEEIESRLAEDPSQINLHSPDGFTPLGFAAYFGRIGAVGVLLDHGADPNIVSQNALGVAPLHSALAGGQSAIAMLLLKGGANPNLVTGEGWSALHYCADIGDAELAELLIDEGADHMVRSKEGKTPGELAADVGHEHVAEAILEAVEEREEE